MMLKSVYFYFAQSGNESKSSFYKLNCLHHLRDDVTCLCNYLDDQIDNHPKPVRLRI